MNKFKTHWIQLCLVTVTFLFSTLSHGGSKPPVDRYLLDDFHGAIGRGDLATAKKIYVEISKYAATGKYLTTDIPVIDLPLGHRNPLETAIENGHVGIVKWLIEIGA